LLRLAQAVLVSCSLTSLGALAPRCRKCR